MKSHNHYITLMPPSLHPWVPDGEKTKQIAVLMSGGVDSSVAAYILKKQGWNVLGITMKIPVACDISSGCCGADAAFVCDKLNISHYFIDTSSVFKQLIIDKFRNEYENGRTPNPCVDCNTLLKFGIVWDFIEKQFGIKNIATGHYAKIARINDNARLCVAQDSKKDQSYFLYGIKADKLRYFHLPLGDISKPQVRKIAEEINLPVANKPESMELCFAGENDYRTALNQETVNKIGELTDMQGNVIGRHNGIVNYTVGQRRGLGYAGGKPLYVDRIDAKSNTVSIGNKNEVSFNIITANQLNWLYPDKVVKGLESNAKMRSNYPAQPCIIDQMDNDTLIIKFKNAQLAPCPGQKTVLYDNDIVIGGGTIVSAQN